MEIYVSGRKIVDGLKVGFAVGAIALPSVALLGCGDSPSQSSGINEVQTDNLVSTAGADQENLVCPQVEAEISDSGC